MKMYSAICRSKRSIQQEINLVIRSEHPTKWAELIRDKDFREEIRQKLRASDDEWCDYKANTCVC